MPFAARVRRAHLPTRSPLRRAFDAVSDLTVGAEEELLLLDPGTLEPAAASEWLLAELGESRMSSAWRPSPTGICVRMDERAVITPYPDGPLIARGAFSLVDVDGREIDAGRRTVALCRCGRSRLRPFCDGTHTRTRYRAEGGLSDAARERHPEVSDPAA